MAKNYHTITLTVSPGGDVNIDVEGLKGKACMDITKSIEEALGGDVTNRKKKTEYFETETVKDKLKTGA